MPKKSDRFRFVIKDANLPNDTTIVWKIRDMRSNEIVFTSQPYIDMDECLEDLRGLRTNKVFFQSITEDEDYLH